MFRILPSLCVKIRLNIFHVLWYPCLTLSSIHQVRSQLFPYRVPGCSKTSVEPTFTFLFLRFLVHLSPLFIFTFDILPQPTAVDVFFVYGWVKILCLPTISFLAMFQSLSSPYKPPTSNSSRSLLRSHDSILFRIHLLQLASIHQLGSPCQLFPPFRALPNVCLTALNVSACVWSPLATTLALHMFLAASCVCCCAAAHHSVHCFFAHFC